MPLEKIPVILLTGIGIHISYTTPTPPTPVNERRMRDLVDINWTLMCMKASDFAIRILNTPKWLTSTKTAYWMYAIIEFCIIVAGTMKSTSWSKRVVTLLLPNGKHPDCIKLTPTTTFATILIVLGTAIRIWSFREMGRHFTFHVTLLKNHKLVTTGPYNIVRHPAYTGAIFVLVGNVIWYTARGSWLRESMVYQMKLSLLFIAPVMLITLLLFSYILRRMPTEDAMMKREFGKDWDEWAKAVPYRLFPGIL